MKYFEWIGEITGVEFPSRHFKEKWWMVEGRAVEEWDTQLIGVYNPSRVGLTSSMPEFNYGPALNGWPIFSPRFSEFIESHTKGLIQFLPFLMRLRADRNARLAGYRVGQLLRLVDCIDRNRTVVSGSWKPINESGDFDIRRPLVLNRALIGEETMFRVLGYRVSIVIREDLKTLIEKSGFLNQRFDPIDTS